MYRSVQAQGNYCGGSDLSGDPLTPPRDSWPAGRRMNVEEQVSKNEYGPGLLDLHSFDTELPPEMSVPGLYDACSMHHFAQGKSFDDSEPYLGNCKHASRAPVTLENNVSKSLAADNVKASNAAKIKVVVYKRPLNKKELTKNEEDIIETHSNSLVVHEPKLKVDLTEYLGKHEFVFDEVLNEEVSNLKVSTPQHLSSALPPTETFEDDMGCSWPAQNDNECYDEDSYEQEKPSRKNSKVEAYKFSNSEDNTRRTNGQTEWKELPKLDMKNSEDNLNALSK